MILLIHLYGVIKSSQLCGLNGCCCMLQVVGSIFSDACLRVVFFSTVYNSRAITTAASSTSQWLQWYLLFGMHLWSLLVIMHKSKMKILQNPKRMFKRQKDALAYFLMFSGKRPFGVSLLYMGWDKHYGYQLYQSDPSGNYSGWKATCIGNNSGVSSTPVYWC